MPSKNQKAAAAGNTSPGKPPGQPAQGTTRPAGNASSLAAAQSEQPSGAPVSGEAVTPEMRMAAALQAAEKSKVLDLCNLGLDRIPEAVWNYAWEHDGMQTPLIPLIKEVKLSNNRITDFEGWHRLANITDLALDRNHLADTLPDAILALTNLTRLNLHSNQLRHLPRIGALEKLLVMLPEELSGCRHLMAIRARGNELKTLPVGITKLWTLEELLLDKNPLVRLPHAVASMPLRIITYDIELLQSPPLAVAAQGPEFTMHYLKLLRAAESRGKLEIDSLKLDMVPIEVCEIHCLMTLSIQHNEIRDIPRAITDLSKLESLNLSSNKIQEIPVFLTALHRLVNLDVSHNLITTVPRGIGYCAGLAAFNLEGNHIFSPPPMILKMGTSAVIVYLRQLCDADKNEKVDLHGLDLPLLPQELSELSLVKDVDISNNFLTSIRPLQVLTQLTSLNVSNNRITELDDDLKKFLHLNTLDVSHNQIRELASAIRTMTELETLNLAYNPLHEVPPGLWSLSRLVKLSVEGCDIRFPPQDVVAKGVKSLLNFQRMIERGRYTRRLDLSGIGFHELAVPHDMWAPLVVLNIDRNYVSTLPGKLQECTALTELRAASNQLVRLPEALGELDTITFLDVRNNVLQSLPQSIILLHKCERLRVSGNRLIALPEPLNGLTALMHLEADDNALTSIPQSLCEIGALTQARFSRNRIVQLPLAIGKLTALQVLTLTSNALVRVPLNLRLLTNLMEFDATDNPEMDLPPVAVVEQGIGATRDFLKMVHATLKTNQLDMSGFGLMWTPKFLASMTGLTGLNLNNNHIDELSTVIPLVNSLTSLSALGNKIKYLPIEIGGRTSLKDLQVDQEILDLCATELHLSASRHVRDYLRRILEGQESNSLKLDNMGLQQLPDVYANSDLWLKLMHLEHISLENNLLRDVQVLANLTLLKTLELNGNQLQTLPDSFGALTALTRVSLQKNKLHGVPLCIQKWSLLKDLVLADNEIVGLPVPLFEALKELATLDCKNNKIHEVKGPIWMLPKLRILDVHGNNVVSPPMAFVHKGKRSVMAYFKSLDTASRSKSLSLKQSDLTSLPSEVIAIKGLTSLVLDENELVTLPDHIAQMKDLATLSVKSNRLASLPDSLSALVNLKELNLSENQLAQLPIGSMMQMRKLSLLNLEHNLLLTAPFELFQTTTLKKIRLAGNDNMTSPPPALINDESKSEALIAFLRLEAQALSSGKVVLINQLASSFPIEIIRLPVVTELVLSKNRIKMISDHIQHLTSMHKLSLDQNLLESLPAALGSCINVTEMRLSGNELFSLPEELSNLQQLNLLDLSKNQFQTLPMALRSCSRLMTLLANYNLITEISPWISSLSNLRSLQLASNQITALPFQVANLSKLHELVLEDNDVTFPPSAIFDAGLDSVRNYLQRLSEAPITKTVDFSGVAMSSFSCHPYMASFRITKMSLKQCGLKQIKPDISHLSALQELDVSQNMLAELPSTIRELSALKYLNADNNALKEITSAVGECRVLRTLSVANNQLTFLPPSLGFATSLKVLTVSGNSIVSPPDVYLRKRSMPWLLQYLRARHESQVSGSLNITSMSLSDIPADVLSQEKLLKLNLNCNDLRDVPKDLQRMVGLQSLSMTNNKLMRVPDAVCEMTWLQSLLLDDNMIKELPIAMNTLNGLRSLSLAHNALSSLPVKLNGLSSLRRLCLDGNTMGEVPRSIMQLTEIRILSMRDCGIAVLPEGITNLVALQELHMNDNTLEILPDLSPCADMRIMRFTNNRLQKLHMSVVGLMELRELSLMGNMMQRLPDDFTQLTKLEILHLDGQNFDSIPADITEQGGKRILEYIRKMALADTTATLDLSGMGVRQLPSAVMLILGLQHLFLHDNPIARIPPMIAQLTNLKTLTLNRTRVHSLPIDLPELYQLKKLELDLEQMMFPPLEVCELGLNAIFSYLRKFLNGAIVGSLDLSNSGMKEIPSDLSLSNGIKTLDLSNNRIARVPPELCLLTNLTVLNLDMNPLRPHVQDVVSHGLEALLKYLRSLYSGAQTGKLDVVQQNLKFYPDEILPEWHITWLRLDDNKIRHLPRKLGHLTDLTTFSVVNNQLEDLPETMVALNALSTLLIDHNEFTQIPSFVCKLSNLTELSATHNRLQSLSDEIGRLQRLQTMRVQGNPDLTHLPFTFGGMKNLRHLEFDTESMVSPDRQFQTDHASIMAYLQTLSDSMLSLSLDLSNRDLKAFPMDVLLLTGLTFLTIARNKIKTLPHNMCHHLSNLRMLDLESNQIENFPDSLGFARNLTCIMALGNSIAVLPNSLGLVHDHGMLLELDPDKITTPPGEVFSRGTSQALAYLRLLQDSVQTRTLSLSKWRLSTLPIEVTDLETLTELSITFNKMKVLPAAVGKLSQLTRLKASDNNLVALPPELAALTRLTDLDVSNNPLDAGFPPKSFLDRGIGTMLALFREVMVCKKIGILEIGHLALEELHLEASTLMDMHRLSLDRASSVHLHHFAFSADASQLTALKEISVCDAQLNFLPAFIPLCTMIQSLNLNNNRFSELPKEICWCLTMLTELRLNHNNIVEIADSISLLTDLRVLALVGNQLTFVNEVIAECCTKLEELHVSNNILTTLPQNLSRCHETLKILDLENNRMSKLPPVAVKLTQLTSLRLSGNPIEDLPLELGRLMYLSEITVPKSDLGNVPRDVVQAGGKAIIKYVCGINDCAGSGLLDLSNMNLHVLPPSIRDLSSSLTYLKLDENPLKRLPNWLGEMQLLSRISVRGTPMQRLPATLGAVASLEEVALDSDSPTLQSPPLEVVARGNSAILSYLRRSYSAVIHRQLDLSGFGLKQFPLMAISTPTTLTSLSLNDNHLEEVPGEVATITGLVMLSLSNNHISVLPAHMFTRMPLLKSLNVGGNPLERLPLTLGGLSKLEYLEFDASNDLTSPPRDITVKSVVAVVTYLKRVWAGRHSATLDLSGLDLTDVPLEVTTWAPFFAPPKIREVAEEEGAEEVLAMGREKKTVGGGEGGPAADVNQIQNGEDTGHGGDEEEEEEAVREAAYAVSDEAGREEQKEERVKALIAAPDMLAGEHAPLEVDRYHNLDDDDRSFEREEDLDVPRTQALQYTLRAGENEDEDAAEDAAEVDSLVSSDEDLGVMEDEDDDQGVPLPPEDSISGYKSLVALDLRSNSIATLRDEVGRMQSLCCVYMCHNDIRVLPNALARLCNLKNLVATHNYIKQLPADFGELKASLKMLDLQHNELDLFPESLEHLVSLVELNVSNNKITKIEIGVKGAMPGLKYLHINNNAITRFDIKGEACFTSLRVLTAVSNEIVDWPDLTQSRRLREMQLSNNNIRKIGAEVKNLRLLRTLDMSNNQLHDLAAELSEAMHLRELILYGNPLDQAPSCAREANTDALFKFLAALSAGCRTGVARFAGHDLGAVPLQLLEVRHLHDVDFSVNGLTLIPRQISHLTQLKVLNLKDNLLHNIPIELSLCPELHTLNLDRNKFMDVVPNICAISQLEVLTLTENNVTTLSYDIPNMVSLVMLDLRGNPNLSKVSQQMLHQSISHLQIYLRSIQMGIIQGGIFLSRRALFEFPIEVHHGNGTIKSLSLAYNEITVMPSSIEQLSCLTHLDISNNLFEKLPDSLGQMTQLAELLLNDNQLRMLPATFVNLTGLIVLALERNPLETFPFEAVENWTGLKQLTIDTEQPVEMPEGPVHTTKQLMPIEVMTQGMSKCISYRERLLKSRVSGSLDLSVMQLSFMPASVMRMPLLTLLNLTGNSLLMIPEGITSLVSMTDLGLNDNRLSTLPPPMAALTSLRILSAIDNRLQYLAPDLGRLSRLEDLNLTNNPGLMCPPPEVFKLGVGSIRNFLNRVSYGKTHGSIELSGLALENLVLPWDDLQSKLQALVLSRNQLEAMPKEADRCTCLTALWVDSNALTTLPTSFGKLCALKSLALDMNQLAALPSCVCDMTALERLTLDNNVLRFLHPRMSELQSLTLLSAANNRLTMLPASLASISCLRSLTLAGNSLAPLPPALRDRHDIDMDVPKV